MSEDSENREPSWRGRTVGLAAVEVDDAELLHHWRVDPVTAHEVGIWPGSVTSARERLERDMENSDLDGFLVLLPDGTPAGYIELAEQNAADGTASVLLMMDPEHRGQGHGTDALDALVDLAFGELPTHRLEALTHTENAPALAVLAKSGFVREGVRRSACLHRGRRHDLAVLALLRPEWEALSRPRAWDV